MKKRSWREVLGKSEKYTDKFKNYKVPDSKAELPNRAEFSGDKFPSTGDSAKTELNHWHSGNSVYQRDKKVEKSNESIPSPVTQEKNKRESIGNEKVERKSNRKIWRSIFSDINFEQKPDGGVSIDVSAPENETEEDETSSDENFSITDSNADTTVEANWRETLRKKSADADIEFKKDPDGTTVLKVKHPPATQPQEVSGEIPSTQYPQTPEAETPSLSQEPSPGMRVNTVSSKKCAGNHKNTKEYVLRKSGNLRLIARECDEKVGIFIERTQGNTIQQQASAKVLDSEIKESNGKSWRELLNQAVWEYKFDQIIKK